MVPAAGAVGPPETVPVLVALVPVAPSVEPALVCLADLPLVRRPMRLEVELKVGMPVSGIRLLDELVVGALEVDVGVAVDVPVVGSEPVLETSLLGVVETAASGVTDPSPNEKLPVVDPELLEGSEAGTTPPPWVELVHRPWHSVVVGAGVEVSDWAGRPFSPGSVTSCPVAVPVVPVVPVVVVVVEVVVSVVVVPGVPAVPVGFVPVAPAPAFAVAPFGVVVLASLVGAGVVGWGVVAVWVVVGAGVALVWVVVVVLAG